MRIVNGQKQKAESLFIAAKHVFERLSEKFINASTSLVTKTWENIEAWI